MYVYVNVSDRASACMRCDDGFPCTGVCPLNPIASALLSTRVYHIYSHTTFVNSSRALLEAVLPLGGREKKNEKRGGSKETRDGESRSCESSNSRRRAPSIPRNTASDSSPEFTVQRNVLRDI